jgi:hypothetical protein
MDGTMRASHSRRSARRSARRAGALLLGALLALPELALAAEPRGVGSLDAMSDAELERYVQKLNEDANWRKYRRPGDPPDFVPGKPVRVMIGAGNAFGRGGARAGMQGFRRSGLGSRRSGLSSRRRGRDDASTQSMRGSSRSSGLGSSSRSSRSGSSFGSGSGSGMGSSFGNSGIVGE